jgi:hypothetical protein
MQNNQFTLDNENLKKAMPVAAGIAVALSVAVIFFDFLNGIMGILLLVAWGYIGVHFANIILAGGVKQQLLNVGLNGAILAAAAGIVYDILTWILAGVRFPDSDIGFSISLYFIQVGLIGGLAALGWYAYKTNN